MEINNIKKKIKTFIRLLRNNSSNKNNYHVMHEEGLQTIQQQLIILDQKINYIDAKIEQLRNDENQHFIKYASYYNPELNSLRCACSDNRCNVLICGYYGAPNLGDELMLQTLIDMLEKFNDISVTIIVHDNQSQEPDVYGNVSILHYPKTKNDYCILAREFDALILGGGAILDDIEYDKYVPYEQTLGQIIIGLGKAFIAHQKKVCAIGLSCNNTYSSKAFIQDLGKIILGSWFFSLRDQYSLTVLERYGINGKNIHMVPDILWANKYLMEQSMKPREKKTRRIGIIWAHFDEPEQYFDDLLSALCNREMIDEIDLIPFYSTDDYDNAFYQKRISNIQIDERVRVQIIDPVWEVKDVIALFQKQQIIINMRYHGALLAGILDIPCINIWHSEHRHYYNKMNYIENEFPEMKNTILKNYDVNKIVQYMSDIFNNEKPGQPRIEKAKESNKEIMRIIENLHKCITVDKKGT